MRGRTMLYVSCGETQEILRFALDPASGALERLGATPLPGAPPPGSAGATGGPQLRSNGAPLKASRDGTMLYAATRTAPCRLLSYRIAPEGGALALIGEAPILEGTVYLAADPSGRWLLGAAYYANSLWVSRIGPDGAVNAPPVQAAGGLTTTHSVLVHPAGELVYVGATGLPGIQLFRLGHGDLPLHDQVQAPAAADDATPRHLALHPGGRFLYAMNETSSVIDVFALSDDGRQLALLQSSDLRPPEARDASGLGADIIVSPDGRFLYGCERRRGTIAAFAIDPASGRLTPVQTVSIGAIPRSIALDPSGGFLASAVQADAVIKLHRVDPADGRLTHIATHETGGTPIWVEFVTLPDVPD